MLDLSLLLQKADVALTLTRLGIVYERRANKNGHELYFACPTDNHMSDPNKKRVSIAESGKYKGLFNCWACKFTGNLIHLVAHLTGVSFAQAIDVLQDQFGKAEVAGTDALIFRLKMNKPEYEHGKEQVKFDLPDDYRPLTHQCDYNSDRAKQWLIGERHITYEYMDRFEIGSTNHPQLGYSIVIPVKFKGNLRSIFYAQPWKGGMKRYPKNSPQGEILFNYDGCLAAKSYIMVESILDVIKYECVVGKPAMACFTNMISKNQLRLLADFDEHGIMPDLDGERGWDLVDRMIPTIGKGAWIYLCPIGKDPGDCTPQELIQATEQRIRYCDYESNQLAAALNATPHKVMHVKK